MTIAPSEQHSNRFETHAPLESVEADRDVTMIESQQTAPDPEEQQRSILPAAFDRPLITGELWYVISAKWMRRWRKYVHFEGFEKDEEAYGKDDFQGSPGPISNNSIVIPAKQNSLPKLKKQQMEKLDYEIIPADVWQKYISWFVTSINLCR